MFCRRKINSLWISTLRHACYNTFMNSQFRDNAIFFVEVEKIKPNPFQPRREFDEAHLESLADSIRMYGVLQPLVVTRKEIYHENGNMATEYELIAGERRLRASKKAGLREIPVLIRATEESDKVKLEIAIIENLQREDLNPIDRAKAFRQLVDEFGMTHADVAKKVGKSREYVSNSMRLLGLPEEMLQAIVDKKISEGHARPLLMLGDRPEEQAVLFKEILIKKFTVRDAEKVARRIAYDKVRKKEKMIDPEIVELEEQVSQRLGTRVHIEKSGTGGKIEIDFFSTEDMRSIIELLKARQENAINPRSVDERMNAHIEQVGGLGAAIGGVIAIENKEMIIPNEEVVIEKVSEDIVAANTDFSENIEEVEFNPNTDDMQAKPEYSKPEESLEPDLIQTPSYGIEEEDKEEDEEYLYSVKQFEI